MLLGDSESFAIDLSVFIHIDGFLGLLGIDEALLGLAIVASFEVEVSLVQEDFGDAFRVILASYLQSIVPVVLVLIHINRLLRLVSLDEFFFGLFKSVFIF